MKRKFFEYGGIAASCVLICISAGAIGLGAWGISEVRERNLAQENIVGARLVHPRAEGRLGSEARAFAAVMRTTRSRPRTADTQRWAGSWIRRTRPTTRPRPREIEKAGQPVSSGARNIWVTETALAGALNMAFLGERVALFGIVMGAALLLPASGSWC